MDAPSPKGREYLCLDGNTRVAIYRELADQDVPGNWTTITAEIIEPDDEEDRVRSIEHIRMISHIVGAREWSAYRQAKYLHELRYSHYFTWDPNRGPLRRPSDSIGACRRPQRLRNDGRLP